MIYSDAQQRETRTTDVCSNKDAAQKHYVEGNESESHAVWFLSQEVVECKRLIHGQKTESQVGVGLTAAEHKGTLCIWPGVCTAVKTH